VKTEQVARDRAVVLDGDRPALAAPVFASATSLAQTVCRCAESYHISTPLATGLQFSLRLLVAGARPSIVAKHTFPVDRADALDDPTRYVHCSREELLDALGAGRAATVLDLGSGTGFYTDDVAPDVGRVLGIDVQRAMHERYRANGVPANVSLLTTPVDSLPLADDTVDGAFSTMTYHEFATPAAAAELARVCRSGARVVSVDWSATGAGDSGPPTDERYDLAHAVETFEAAGFQTVRASTRRETFVHVCRRV
jgi:SAM-dependent methyltransferase